MSKREKPIPGRGRHIVRRKAGFADDYRRAHSAEMLEAEHPPDAVDVAGGEEEALAVTWVRRGPATHVVRRPHATAMLGDFNYLIQEEMQALLEKLTGSDGLTEDDYRRLDYLNTWMNRNLREEREQTKLERIEDMDKADMLEALRAEVAELEAEVGEDS